MCATITDVTCHRSLLWDSRGLRRRGPIEYFKIAFKIQITETDLRILLIAEPELYDFVRSDKSL